MAAEGADKSSEAVVAPKRTRRKKVVVTEDDDVEVEEEEAEEDEEPASLEDITNPEEDKTLPLTISKGIRYVNLIDLFPLLPKKGDFQISTVKDTSVYFFS